jgi:uncharacterized protein (DUF2141 family)
MAGGRMSASPRMRQSLGTLGLAAALLAAAAPARAATLVVAIEGLRNDQGDVHVSLFASPAEWPDHSRDENDRVVPARRGGVAVSFEVPPGRYALAGFHDENRNGEFDTNFLGIPREGYCFSNGARPGLKEPAFDAAAITVPEGGTRIVMHMVYW